MKRLILIALMTFPAFGNAAAYANVVYSVLGGTFKEVTKVSGCGTINTNTKADLYYYDDGSYAINRDDGVVVTGKWAEVKSNNKPVIYMNYNEASKDILVKHYDDMVSSACSIKHGDNELISINAPTIIIKRDNARIKNYEDFKSVSNMTAFQMTDVDGMVKNGKFKTKIVISGTVFVGN